MERQRGIGIVGARALPVDFRPQVTAVVQRLIERGYGIYSGGAVGADQFALEAVFGLDAFRHSVVFSAWDSVSGFPATIRQSIHSYIAYGGMVDWGAVSSGSGRGAVIAGLLERNSRLVSAACGLVAFLYGDSRGTCHTIAEAIRRGRRVIVFVCGGGASLPAVGFGHWVRLGGTSPFSGAHIFLPEITVAQRETAMVGPRAVRVLQEVSHG
jgi:hypothetical protein